MSKASLVALGVGIVAAGAIVLTSKSEIPNYHFLSDDEGYWVNSSDPTTVKTEYQNKYGATYGNYLTGIENKNNDAWWEWAFANRYLPKKNEAKGKFKQLTQASKLKNLCLEAYKATNDTNGNIVTIWTSEDNNKFLEKDILYFCSPLEKKPTTLSSREEEKNKYTGKIGSMTDKLSKLVSIEDPDNALFWERRNKDFFGVFGIFSGKTNGEENKFFKNLWDKNISQGKTIKDKCKEAYNKETTTTSSSESAPKPDEVVKFCSWEGK